MASFLSTLGITNTAAPDPSTYTNIKAENANLAEAKTELNSILSNISIATNAAQVAGLSPSYTESLTALSNEATSAANSNMTSAQIAAKNTEIAAKIAELKEQQKVAVQQQKIDEMNVAVKMITDRVIVIRGDKTTPELLEKYETLLTNVNAAFEAVKVPPTETPVTMPPTEMPVTVPPVYLTPAQYLDELDSLDTLKDAEEKKDFNWSRLAKQILGWTMYFIMIISVILGFLFGGIIMSNTFAEDAFWAIKIYYFIYGAALFPISISMGAISPPYWVSTIIPLFISKNIPATAATATAAPIRVLAPVAPTKAIPNVPRMPGIPAVSDLPTLPSLGIKIPSVSSVPAFPSVPVIDPKKSILSALTKLPGLPQYGGATETGGLFSYQLVDPKHPTESQKLWKNILRGISISELILLLSVSVYYRLDKILFTNIKNIINKIKK